LRRSDGQQGIEGGLIGGTGEDHLGVVQGRAIDDKRLVAVGAEGLKF
jgi:hypothetical protein